MEWFKVTAEFRVQAGSAQEALHNVSALVQRALPTPENIDNFDLSDLEGDMFAIDSIVITPPLGVN